MAEQLSKNEEQKPDTITVNDPSFNVRYQPTEIISNDKDDTSKTLKEKFNETTSAISDSMNFDMQFLLQQALYSLENFTNPKLPVDQRIPNEVLNDAKGIMFLSVVKGGLGIGGMVGTGIIMARNPNWRTEWTSPCAIGLGGLQIGFNIGFEKTDHIIIIRDEDVVSKFHSGIRLGGDISLSVGPLGRDTNVGLTVNEKGVIPNVSYSMSKGVYMGFALEGSVITIRNDCNEKFFGQKCDVLQILNGSVKVPFDQTYISLCKTLGSFGKPISDESSLNTDTTQIRNESSFDTTRFKDENHPILNITSDTKNP